MVAMRVFGVAMLIEEVQKKRDSQSRPPGVALQRTRFQIQNLTLKTRSDFVLEGDLRSIFVGPRKIHSKPFDHEPQQPPTIAITQLTQSSNMPNNDNNLCDVGLYGLAVMGQNFALNMASHGFSVCVGNRSPSKVQTTVQRAQQEGNLPIVGSDSPQDFCAKLSTPRKIVLLVQAGKPVDLTIQALLPHLQPGDCIIDGGNEWFPNQVRRYNELKEKGLLFLGMGISGGEEGARNGPSLMPGGPREAYDLVEPILMSCAAKAGEPEEPCTGYCGPIGAGNYVKMVHNGIEYGDMQLISEVYDILKVCVCCQHRRWSAASSSDILSLLHRASWACPTKKCRNSLSIGTRASSNPTSLKSPPRSSPRRTISRRMDTSLTRSSTRLA